MCIFVKDSLKVVIITRLYPTDTTESWGNKALQVAKFVFHGLWKRKQFWLVPVRRTYNLAKLSALVLSLSQWTRPRVGGSECCVLRRLDHTRAISSESECSRATNVRDVDERIKYPTNSRLYTCRNLIVADVWWRRTGQCQFSSLSSVLSLRKRRFEILKIYFKYFKPSRFEWHIDGDAGIFFYEEKWGG